MEVHKSVTNTFEKVGSDLSAFLKLILDSEPDFIVPVQKKGCKLLRYAKLSDELFCAKVRYLQFFENNGVSLRGKRVAIVDDATKYTSMLYQYRSFFEDLGAMVKTYSYVGQKKIKVGERNWYDTRAYIHKFLEESTYQEYIAQQSIILSRDDYFYDIDHFVVCVKMPESRYEELVRCFSKIGDVEFANDVYTPKSIEKISIINIGFRGAESLFGENISQGALQKIRFAYNTGTKTLTVAPLSFPIWDSNGQQSYSQLFEKIPFDLPYEDSDDITNNGIYFNIVYTFHLCLLKYFFEQFSSFVQLREFQIFTQDFIAFCGAERANIIEDSARKFLLSDKICISAAGVSSPSHRPAQIPQKSKSAFPSIKSIMDELRGKYLEKIEQEKTLLNVRYFLAYEEIIERYSGKENLMKWIDILCDRGVLVTRNYSENGMFYRACRSGEANYDQIERKSYALLPMAINACGEIQESDGTSFCYINPTYLNKVLANLVYDYPSDEYSFHGLFVRPCYFGPLTYVEDRINDSAPISIYHIDKVTHFCLYDNSKKKFISCSTEVPSLRIAIDECFGQQDAISYEELAGYLGFLKCLKEDCKTDNFLNALAICREESVYSKYVRFNLATAFDFIQYAKQSPLQYKKEKYLREAACNIKSAKEKLKYNQDIIISRVHAIRVELVYEKAREKILKSFQPFSQKFCSSVLPVMNLIATTEYFLVNMMLFSTTENMIYWRKFYSQFQKQGTDVDAHIVKLVEMLNDLVSARADWDQAQQQQFDVQKKNVIDYFLSMIFSLLKQVPRGNEQEMARSRRENNIYALNYIKRFSDRYAPKTIVSLYFTYSGYKNMDDQKNVNIVNKVQTLINELYIPPEHGKVIFGASGSNEYGLIVFDSIELALGYAKDLIESTQMFSHVFFRFGCSAIKLDRKSNIDEQVLAVIQNAARATQQINSRSSFVLDQSTLQLIEKSAEASGISRRFIEVTHTAGQYYECQEIKNMVTSVFKYQTDKDETVKIGIITVLLEEHTAMRSMLRNAQDVVFPGKSGNQFVIGEISAYGGDCHRVAVARTIGDGNNKASVRARSLLEHFPNLDVIFMVGIAGGAPLVPGIFECDERTIREKHVRLGDIVVGTGIVQFDYVKKIPKQTALKGHNNPPCAMVEVAQQRLCEEEELTRTIPWVAYIEDALKNLKSGYARPDCSTDILHAYDGTIVEHPVDESRTPNLPRVFRGIIASSNTVLKRPKKRDQLKKKYDVYAIEMETSGVSDATWEAGIGYYAVRGICDYCDSFKNDIWHNYAALAAAAYTRALIEKIPRYPLID